MNKTWTLTEEQYLRDNYQILTHRQMAFSLGKIEGAVKAKCKALCLRLTPEVKLKRLQAAQRIAQQKMLLTPEEDAIIREKYLQIPIKTLAKEIGRSSTGVKGSLKRQGLKIPKALADERKQASHYKIGAVSFNTGKRQSEYMSAEAIERTKATQFQKGFVPHNTKQNGQITKRADGYWYKRLSLGQWKPLHHLLWCEQHGEIPAKMCLTMKDGNKENITLDNLELITKKENIERNRNEKMFDNARNLADTYVAGVLKRKTNLTNTELKEAGLIDFKRQQLLINRELKKIAQNESESKKASNG
jgi:hypothetical protein